MALAKRRTGGGGFRVGARGSTGLMSSSPHAYRGRAIDLLEPAPARRLHINRSTLGGRRPRTCAEIVIEKNLKCELDEMMFDLSISRTLAARPFQIARDLLGPTRKKIIFEAWRFGSKTREARRVWRASLRN